MNKNYLTLVSESKASYHRSLAGIPYEEKLKIIIKLQKIDTEMRKNKKRRADDKFRMIWEIEGLED
jgi:hypothetical protein